MHASRRVLTVLTLVALFAFTMPWALAQGSQSGSLSGTVVDQSGAAVSTATISATESQTNRTFTAKTNAQGAFQIPTVPPGIYNIKVSAPNFETVQYQSVQVVVGRDTATGIAKMKVGGEQQTVTVEGAAPLVESSTVQIQDTFTSKQTADLPIGNGFDQLALFVPGVTSLGGQFSNTNGAELSVNGQRGRSNNFQIDGQYNNDNSVAGPALFFGNQDAIAELQVITNYTAEYGRNMGSVVNYVTKSGTNSFHGTGFEYYNGSWGDSLDNLSKNPLQTGPNGNPFCAPGETSTHVFDSTANNGVGGIVPSPCDKPVVPRFVDNRFGGSVGGPIIKNKLWFFGSTNWERQRVGQTAGTSGSATTFTPQAVAALAAADPTSPAVQFLQQFGPGAVSAGNPQFGGVQNQTFTTLNGQTVTVPVGTVSRFVPSIANDKEATGRIDTQLTNKDRLFGRYVYQEQINTGVPGESTGFAQGDWVDVPARAQSMGLDWTRNWTNTFFDQSRFSFSRTRVTFEGGSFPGCTDANILNCPPSIGFEDNTLGLGRANNLPQGRIVNTYAVQNNANWQHGRHSFKFGGEYDKQRSPNVFLPNVNGTFLFPDLQSFLLNTPDQTTITQGNPNLPFQEKDVAAYGEDDWRIKDNLTLNLGVRWEWFQQAENLLHDRSLANQTSSNPLWNATLPLSLTTVRKTPEDLNNWGPVVGFAWTPHIWQGLFGQEKTVIRGGFRIAYDPAFYNIFLNIATSAPTVNAAVLTPANGAIGLPAGGPVGSNISTGLTPFIPTGVNPGLRSQTNVSPNFHNPYSEQWNFGMQRQLNGRVAAEVRYVANHTVGNFMSINANPSLGRIIAAGEGSLIPAGLTPCSDPTQPGFNGGNALKPGATPLGFEDCNHTVERTRNNGSFGKYQSLQTELRIQNWHGIAGNISYTFSKNEDNVSEIFSTFGGGNTVTFAQNPFNPSAGEAANSGIDFPHTLAVSLIYNLPFFANQQGLVGKLFGGIQWNATYRYLSGQPYTTSQLLASRVCDSSNLGGGADLCRPFLGNTAAPLNSTAFCFAGNSSPTGCTTGPATQDSPGGTGQPINLADAHWIVNTPFTANLLGVTPFNGSSRNLSRGDAANATNMSIFKNTKLTERLNMRLEFTVYNPFNIQFKGTPDVFINDAGLNCPTGVAPSTAGICPDDTHIASSFANTRFNSTGGGQVNTIQQGIGTRRVQLGAKFIF
jgi:outer membrane receptor protein involved in Fe transport